MGRRTCGFGRWDGVERVAPIEPCVKLSPCASCHHAGMYPYPYMPPPGAPGGPPGMPMDPSVMAGFPPGMPFPGFPGGPWPPGGLPPMPGQPSGGSGDGPVKQEKS